MQTSPMRNHPKELQITVNEKKFNRIVIYIN